MKEKKLNDKILTEQNQRRIRRALEVLNILTGFGLLAIALTYVPGKEYDYAANWAIFGCMYIVMDKYWLGEFSMKRKITDWIKCGFGILGLCIVVAFLVLRLFG
jgi:hypothetical protein